MTYDLVLDIGPLATFVLGLACGVLVVIVAVTLYDILQGNR